MLLTALSTLISSIALVAVAIGLFLQARQLRASRIQAARASQVELTKFAIDNPAMVNRLDAVEDIESFIKGVVRNWYFTYLSMSYDNGTISKSGLRRVASVALADEATFKWCAQSGYTLDEVATSRREKEFFTIVDNEFQQVKRAFDSDKADDESPNPASDPPSPSDP